MRGLNMQTFSPSRAYRRIASDALHCVHIECLQVLQTMLSHRRWKGKDHIQSIHVYIEIVFRQPRATLHWRLPTSFATFYPLCSQHHVSELPAVAYRKLDYVDIGPPSSYWISGKNGKPGIASAEGHLHWNPTQLSNSLWNDESKFLLSGTIKLK